MVVCSFANWMTFVKISSFMVRENELSCLLELSSAIFYLKINNKKYLLSLNKNTKTQLRIKLRFTVFSLHVLIRTCLNVWIFLISSDFLFNMLLSLMWLIIQSFSVKHNLHIVNLALL